MNTPQRTGKVRKRKVAMILDKIVENTPSPARRVCVGRNAASRLAVGVVEKPEPVVASTSSPPTVEVTQSCTDSPSVSLGARGSILLEQLLRLIPVNFRNYRHQYIANILNSALKKCLTPADVKQLVAGRESIPRMQDVLGSLPLDLLWDTTLKHGNPHTCFLSPPLESCLVCASTLATHNQPTVCICYTPDGPIPAVKITLRCQQCSINYR